MTTSADPPRPSASAEPARRSRAKWWWLAIGVTVAGLFLSLLVPLVLPLFPEGEVVEVDDSKIFGESSSNAEPGLSMNGYLALSDRGAAVVDRSSGEVTAEWYNDYLSGGSYRGDPEVVHIDEDGTALMVADSYADRLELVRVEGEKQTPLELGEPFIEANLVGTFDSVVVISGCSDGSEVLAGYDPEDLSEVWRLHKSTRYCTPISSRSLVSSRYLTVPWGKDRTLHIVDSETGKLIEPRPDGAPLADPSGVVYGDTVLMLTAAGEVVSLEAATGEELWRLPGCRRDPGYAVSWAAPAGSYGPTNVTRYPMLSCAVGLDQTESVVFDVEEGRRSQVFPTPELQSQRYVSGEAPAWDEQPVDDFERPVTPMLVGDVMVARVGGRIAGTDVFTGKELWTKTLDLDEHDVVEVSSGGLGEGASVVIEVDGETAGWLGTGLGAEEHRTAAQVLDPHSGELRLSTRRRDIRVLGGPPARDLLVTDDDRGDLYLVAEPE